MDEEYRGQGLAMQINRAREEKAREEKCDYVACKVLPTNPIGVVSKLNDGYTIISTMSTRERHKEALYLSKRIDTNQRQYDKKVGPPREYEEIELTDIDVIKFKLNRGWVGIDIKNIGDKTDNDPKNWKLILEKR